MSPRDRPASVSQLDSAIGWEQPLGSMDSMQRNSSPWSIMIPVVGGPERHIIMAATKRRITSL